MNIDVPIKIVIFALYIKLLILLDATKSIDQRKTGCIVEQIKKKERKVTAKSFHFAQKSRGFGKKVPVAFPCHS